MVERVGLKHLPSRHFPKRQELFGITEALHCIASELRIANFQRSRILSAISDAVASHVAVDQALIAAAQAVVAALQADAASEGDIAAAVSALASASSASQAEVGVLQAAVAPPPPPPPPPAKPSA